MNSSFSRQQVNCLCIALAAAAVAAPVAQAHHAPGEDGKASPSPRFGVDSLEPRDRPAWTEVRAAASSVLRRDRSRQTRRDRPQREPRSRTPGTTQCR